MARSIPRPARAPVPTRDITITIPAALADRAAQLSPITIHDDSTYTVGPDPFAQIKSGKPSVAERIAARRKLQSDRAYGLISEDEYWRELQRQRANLFPS